MGEQTLGVQVERQYGPLLQIARGPAEGHCPDPCLHGIVYVLGGSQHRVQECGQGDH